MVQQQQRRKSNKAEATEMSATSVHNVPDDVLWLILLHLDSPLWLIRAACTCKRWRGLIAADGCAILRMARTLHPPAVAGHYHHRSGPIAFTPSSPEFPIDGRHFSLDFLPPSASKREVVDCHGGLVLLLVPPQALVVCNPLTRQYRGVKCHPRRQHDGCVIANAFLLDGDDSDISLSNFRVVYRFNIDPRTWLFSRSNGDGSTFLWSSANDLDKGSRGQVAGRVDGCLYLGLMTGGVIALDSATLEFSRVDLPIGVDPSKEDYHASFRVVHSAGGPASPPTARIVHANGEELEVFRRVHGTGHWVLEHSICRLSEVARGMPSYLAERPFRWAVRVIADGVGFAVLSVLDFSKRRWLFTVDVVTMEVQFVPESSYHLYRGTTTTSTYTLPYMI